MGGYGLLGEHLGHSFSPEIHKRLGGYDYALFEKSPEELGDFLRSGKFDGINVTIPYKKAVVPYCSSLSDKARETGSVNTLVRRADGSLYGDNTDYYGFLYMLRRSGLDIAGKKCVVFGDGGVAPTVRAALRDAGAGEIVTVSRRGENNYGNLSRHYDANILVNATPVGMYPKNGEAVASLTPFYALEGAFDLVYNPHLSEFLREAKELGAVAVNGLGMLVAQAKRAVELFLGREIDDALIEPVRADIERRSLNVALIGMAGCGKSSVGAALAAMTGRKFVDCDNLVPQYSGGRSIEEIFETDGEDAFRRTETRILRDVSRESGLVIATGGGVVTTPENLPLLRQNSVTVLLRRDIDELPVDGRPLSRRHGKEALYKKRKPLYEAWGEYAFDCDGVENTAKRIKEALFL